MHHMNRMNHGKTSASPGRLDGKPNMSRDHDQHKPAGSGMKTEFVTRTALKITENSKIKLNHKIAHMSHGTTDLNSTGQDGLIIAPMQNNVTFGITSEFGRQINDVDVRELHSAASENKPDRYMHEKHFNTMTSSSFLLEDIYINTLQGIALAMIMTICIAILVESTNYYIFTRRTHLAVFRTIPGKKMSHLVTTLLKVLSVALGYLLMLIAMKMNIWLVVSVILGSGIGNLLIRPLISCSQQGAARIMVREQIVECQPLCDLPLNGDVINNDKKMVKNIYNVTMTNANDVEVKCNSC